jgi:hypothetical protein
LLGRHFTVRTDHNSLTWLMNFKEPQGQLARWLEELSQFNYLDSLDTFPSKSISRFPCRDPDLSHPRSHFFFLLVLTLTHGLTPRLFRLQSKIEITGFAMWGVSLLY